MASPRIDPGAVIGPGCEVHPDAVVGAGVELGRDVRIGAGSIVLGPCRIGDRCLVSAGCVLDPVDGPGDGRLVLEADVVLMPGVVIPSRLLVAGGARIEAGTVLQRPVPPHAIVAGNPAQITGYATAGDPAREAERTPGTASGPVDSVVAGVTLHRLPRILDLRGNLSVGEFGETIPFEARRYFVVFGVPNAEIRGEHAHRTCKQFLVCVHGSCHVVADDGRNRQEFVLDDPSLGVYLPPLTWGIQYRYSQDAVLLVFASEHYDSAEYIRDYGEFLALASSRQERP